MMNKKGKQEIEEDGEDTVPENVGNNVGTFYVHKTEFSGINDVDKNDIRFKVIPSVSWADIVRNDKMKIQQE